jgi:hypothetical protein
MVISRKNNKLMSELADLTIRKRNNIPGGGKDRAGGVRCPCVILRAAGGASPTADTHNAG